MNFSNIFGVFSKRAQSPIETTKPLTPEFRYRVVHLLSTAFQDPVIRSYGRATESMFWHETHERLLLFHGRSRLGSGTTSSSQMDTLQFLEQCTDVHFLDFIELAFQWKYIWDYPAGPGELVKNINQFFDVDDLPYVLIGPSNDSRVLSSMDAVLFRVLQRENDVLYQNAVEPTLTLLTRPVFELANNEFLNALTDYRKGDYSDCVTKCGSSFESVMKVICKSKGFSYRENDTAEPLLNAILDKSNLDSFFKQPVMLIATIRNRLSSAHGAGTEQRVVSKHIAHYVLNATASAILLLVEETNP